MTASMKSLLVGILAAAALVVPAAAAQAVPADCTFTPVTRGSSVVCSSGTGTYMIYVECRVPGDTRTVEGNLAGIGGTSTATCPAGSTYLGANLEVWP